MSVRSIAAATLLATATIASSASARVFSVGTDFGNPVFNYGTVSAGGTFTAFGLSDCSNIGVTGTCYRGTDTFQVVFKHSPDTLLIHPGPNDLQTTFVTFTAPRTGAYTFDLTVTRGDTGDGVNVYGFGPTGLIPLARVDAATPTFNFAGTLGFTAGEQIGIGVDRGGATSNYFGDSTILSGSISGAVPEPAAWALMIAGFGLVGVGMRRRPAVTLAA